MSVVVDARPPGLDTSTYDTEVRPLSIHAVFFALNETSFFTAALSSVYEAISGATVITSYDRDRYGNHVEPEGLVELILSRAIDPERKVNLIVTNEGSEPQARNRAMAYARHLSPTVTLDGEPPGLQPPDLFWHIDSDEVYDPADIAGLLAWIDAHPAKAYRMELLTYFRTWNWRIDEQGSFTALTRPDFCFGDIRNPYPNIWTRAWAKAAQLGWVPDSYAWHRTGAVMVPPEVAVCHHGSYVGSRQRVADKVARSSHISEMSAGWMDRVWDRWTPELRDFHPTVPTRFPAAVHVATAELPPAIRDGVWPDGWIEPLRPPPNQAVGFSNRAK